MQTETFLPSRPRFRGRVGLLAGGGRFPIYFAEAARRQGIEVVCVAIKDHADAALKDLVDRFHWTGIARMGRMIRCFQKENIDCVVMAGKVEKSRMFTPFRIFRYLPDWRMVRAWLSKQREDNKDDSMLLMLIEEFRKDGIRFASALEICPELLVRVGTPTRRKPTARQRSDIAFGWKLAKEMGRLDVGQSVCVKESAVLAVEAIEGTDRSILRAGDLCRAGGFTVVKVAKPTQDMRFDVPTVGVTTIETMKKAGASVLAIEADKTILMDSSETVELADKYGISIVVLTAEEAVVAPEAA
jgi:DUF1009 family protein